MKQLVIIFLVVFSACYIGFNQNKLEVQNEDSLPQSDKDNMIDVLPEHPYENLLKSATKPVIMFIHAPGCSQSQTMYPIMDRLRNQYGRYFQFETIDVEDNNPHMNNLFLDFQLNGKSSRISMACVKNPFCSRTIDAGESVRAPSIYYINPKTRERLEIDRSNYFDQNLLSEEFYKFTQLDQ